MLGQRPHRYPKRCSIAATTPGEPGTARSVPQGFVVTPGPRTQTLRQHRNAWSKPRVKAGAVAAVPDISKRGREGSRLLRCDDKSAQACVPWQGKTRQGRELHDVSAGLVGVAL